MYVDDEVTHSFSIISFSYCKLRIVELCYLAAFHKRDQKDFFKGWVKREDLYFLSIRVYAIGHPPTLNIFFELLLSQLHFFPIPPIPN